MFSLDAHIERLPHEVAVQTTAARKDLNDRRNRKNGPEFADSCPNKLLVRTMYAGSFTEAPLSLLDDVPVQLGLLPVWELLPRSQLLQP